MVGRAAVRLNNGCTSPQRAEVSAELGPNALIGGSGMAGLERDAELSGPSFIGSRSAATRPIIGHPTSILPS